MNAQDQVRSSALFARELLSMVADGIGKLEQTAGTLPQMASKTLARGLPALARRDHGHGSGVVRSLLIGGVVVGTAALIYSRVRAQSRGTRGRWSGMHGR
jgi:hypothetical protein